MPFYKNVFHNPFSNDKYLHKKSQQEEVIINRETGEIIYGKKKPIIITIQAMPKII